MLHQETITKKMHDIASVIYYQFDTDYYLAGGTSIALLLGHRESIDLDYFIQKDIDTNTLKRTIKEIWSNVIFTYEEKNTLWCDIEGVKVSFISRKDMLIEPVIVEDVFRLASLSDSVVMKLNALCSREEYKDYYDIATLSKVSDVRTWVMLWNKVYSESDPISFIVSLSFVSHIEEVSLKAGNKYSNKEVIRIVTAISKEISSFL